jgi:hypothetical protein
MNVEAHHEPIGEGGDKNARGVPRCAECHRMAHCPKERSTSR